VTPSAVLDRESLETLPLVDHDATDWARVRRTTYLIRQQVCYQYPSPVTDLRQRLMVLPPPVHGDQRRLAWYLDVSDPARRCEWKDRFGNPVIDLEVDRVETSIQFRVCVALERASPVRPHRVAIHRSWARATPLTAADAELGDAASQLIAAGQGGPALAERICEWVFRRLDYRYGVTAIETTATEACALGAGVCQDYAHVMLAICRKAGIPARYVSGHLLGQGGSHAWVEVVYPDPQRSGWVAMALDPTHGRHAGLQYLTVASGRDYRDVAPTSGTCLASDPGALHVSKQAGLASVDYDLNPRASARPTASRRRRPSSAYPVTDHAEGRASSDAADLAGQGLQGTEHRG
jgi:transglutaminase-like putative cysteine protease